MSDRLRLRLYAWLNSPPNRTGVLLIASKPNCPELGLTHPAGSPFFKGRVTLPYRANFSPYKKLWVAQPGANFSKDPENVGPEGKPTEY